MTSTPDHTCGGRTDGYGGFTCVRCGEYHPADHLDERTEKLPMDRKAVIDRMAEAKWEQYRAVDGQNRVPWERTIEIVRESLRAEVAEYLDASGLMEALSVRTSEVDYLDGEVKRLQAELRHLKGRPAVPGKPLEVQPRDELLVAINERDLLIESQQSMIRELDEKLAEMEADVERKDEALREMREVTRPCTRDTHRGAGSCDRCLIDEALAPQPAGAKPA
ncbi:MAG: hypothetical protein BGO49_24675 [Planctomycetales bacterium 71-10]|nr:MAG: hypothetical protein BGO49_24675 [Planctomycetales bacterium 71-10]